MNEKTPNENNNPVVGMNEPSAEYTGPTPGAHEMFMETRRGATNIPEEMLSTSQKPEQYWGRTVIDLRTLQRKRRIAAHYNMIYYGTADIMGLQWIDIVARQSIDGRARTEVVKILTGGGGGFKDKALGWMRGGNKQDEEKAKW